VSGSANFEPYLIAQLGFSPASLDAAAIERHRRLNAALDVAPTQERITRKYQHLAEERRRTEVEESGRRDVADF
jgi:hypothetical protein